MTITTVIKWDFGSHKTFVQVCPLTHEGLIQHAELLTVHFKYVNLKYLVPEGGSRPHGCDES